jgi:hypothetical protein
VRAYAIEIEHYSEIARKAVSRGNEYAVFHSKLHFACKCNRDDTPRAIIARSENALHAIASMSG